MTTPLLDTDELHARLATVVGADHVSALAPDARYGGLLGAHVDAALRPRALVRPASAEQLQRLATMVAELGHGLWSTGNACGNGAQRGHPRKPGVLVDLARMNRIIDVDRRGACAVLEAGVTYDQLADHLRERELPLWLDADANGAHTVAGSLAARHWGLTPLGDHLAARCGVEAVLANGTLLRTGLGALAGSDVWSRTRHGFGPALDGLFTRAHFGVVTKVGMCLLPEPRQFMPFALSLPDLASVARMVDGLRPLLLDGSLGGRLLVASRQCDNALVTRQAGSAGGEPGAAPWTLYGALYGLPAVVAQHGQALATVLGAVPGAGTGPAWGLRLRQLRGEALYSDPSGDDACALSFSVLAPATGAAALALHHGVLTRLAEFAPRLAFVLAPRLVALEVELPDADSNHDDALAGCLAAVKDLVGAGYALKASAPALDATLAARHTPPGLRHLYDGLATALDPYAMLATRGKFVPDKRGRRG